MLSSLRSGIERMLSAARPGSLGGSTVLAADAQPPGLRKQTSPMPMMTLSRHGMNEYLAVEQGRASRLACFIHVPKTAGSSLTAELASILQPYKNLFITTPDPAKSFDQNYVSLLKSFWSGPEAAKARLVSGHFTYSHLLGAGVALDRVRLITFLRHPVDRCISDFRYSSSPAHPQHQHFRELYPTIDHYLRNAGEMNKMWTYFRAGPNEDAEVTARRMAEEFSFVGLTEAYDQSTSILFALLRSSRKPTLRRNVTMNAEVTVESFNEKRRQIAEANAKDMAVYEFFHQLYQSIEQPAAESADPQSARR